MKEEDKANAIKYSDLIPSPEEFSGERFREILKSRGITIMCPEENRRMIRIEGHDGLPAIYINVPGSGHKFDKYVFSGTGGIEKRLQYLNTILLSSGYVNTKITLDMLNSNDKCQFELGDVALGEIEHYERNKKERNLPKEILFNHPDGKIARLQEMKKRWEEDLSIDFSPKQEPLRISPGLDVSLKKEYASTICQRFDSQFKLTAVLGGKTVNLSLSTQQQQKMMALDNSHRLKFLSQLAPEMGLEGRTDGEKAQLLKSINEQLFGKPSIFVSETNHFVVSEEQHVQKNTSAQVIASSAFESVLEESGNVQQGNVIRR